MRLSVSYFKGVETLESITASCLLHSLTAASNPFYPDQREDSKYRGPKTAPICHVYLIVENRRVEFMRILISVLSSDSEVKFKIKESETPISVIFNFILNF